MKGRAYDPAKRLIDIVAALVGLITTAPVQAAVALLVRWNLGSPVLFRQARPGKDERVFELVKFRSMRDVDAEQGLVTDEQRLTRFGRLLRTTSFDELPSLWNVLKGDMSLVGPRPLLVKYLPLYSEEQRRRHEVRPGVTGLAQISGRNGVSWPEKFRFDVHYVDERAISLDLKILALTVLKVIRRDGINEVDSATMTEFLGAQEDAR